MIRSPLCARVARPRNTCAASWPNAELDDRARNVPRDVAAARPEIVVVMIERVHFDRRSCGVAIHSCGSMRPSIATRFVCRSVGPRARDDRVGAAAPAPSASARIGARHLPHIVDAFRLAGAEVPPDGARYAAIGAGRRLRRGERPALIHGCCKKAVAQSPGAARSPPPRDVRPASSGRAAAPEPGEAQNRRARHPRPSDISAVRAAAGRRASPRCASRRASRHCAGREIFDPRVPAEQASVIGARPRRRCRDLMWRRQAVARAFRSSGVAGGGQLGNRIEREAANPSQQAKSAAAAKLEPLSPGPSSTMADVATVAGAMQCGTESVGPRRAGDRTGGRAAARDRERRPTPCRRSARGDDVRENRADAAQADAEARRGAACVRRTLAPLRCIARGRARSARIPRRFGPSPCQARAGGEHGAPLVAGAAQAPHVSSGSPAHEAQAASASASLARSPRVKLLELVVALRQSASATADSGSPQSTRRSMTTS